MRFDDPYAEAINRVIKETARKTAEKVGDGTTTSILLAVETMVHILTHSSEDISKALEQLVSDAKIIKNYVNTKKTDLINFEDDRVLEILKSIISISSNGDEEVVNTLMEVLEKIGPNGLIDVTTSRGEITTTSIQDGVLIESLAHVHNTLEIKLPYVALVANKLEKVHQVKTLLLLANRLFTNDGSGIIVVAKEFAKEVVDVININNRNMKTAVYLVEVDGYANNMLDILDDISLILNCKVLSIDSSSPYGLQNVAVDHLGQAGSAIITPQQTVIYPGVEMSEDALNIKKELEESIQYLKSTGEDRAGEIRQLEKRLTKFSKSATIRVGGYTDTAKIELKDRVEDAVQAIHSAVNNGVIPGGGMVLYKASNWLGDTALGHACKVPAMKLNNSIAPHSFDLDIIYDKDEEKVIDFKKLEVVPTSEMRILDPAEVLLKAIDQAVAIAKVLLGSYGMLIQDHTDYE